MIRRALLLAVPALLAGCSAWPFGGRPARPADGPPDPVRAECEAHVDDDPEVKQQRATNATRAGYAPVEANQALDAAKQDAVQRCLLQHGHVGLGGGVERPR
jgi:hypothetical protein